MVEIACLDLGQALRWLVPVIGNDGEFNWKNKMVLLLLPMVIT